MAAPRRNRAPWNQPVILTFLLLAIVTAMALAAEVLKPLALSVLLAFALTPLSDLFEKRLRLPRAAAAVLTVLLALSGIAGIGYVVGYELTGLAGHLPADRDRILQKLTFFEPSRESALNQARAVAGEVAERLDSSAIPRANVSNVRVIAQPDFGERFRRTVGPYVEFLGIASFVLILVLFMMIGREDLRDRVVALFGSKQVSLTTRTLDEMGQRISRYLATFATVNSLFGLVIGTGLWLIGVEFAVLWGCLAALLRFIPYVGPAVAFVLPLTFSVAEYEGWRIPLEVVALFGVVETLLNSAIEPVVYGKTTGTSSLGLLVAAMFWAWLWGVLGILLSTPLTVCLAVLGKEVPALRVFSTLLGEEPELEPDIRFYQRLVALDRDGAVEIIDEALRSRPRAEVYDAMLVPALSRAERDTRADVLDDREQAFVRRVVEEIVDDLEDTTEISLTSVADPATMNEAAAANPASLPAHPDDDKAAADPAESIVVLGLAAGDTADAIVLKMLGQLIAPAGFHLEIVTDAPTPLALADRIAARVPGLVVLSQLPPDGLSEARYRLHRLRARFASLPILVGRWGDTGRGATVVTRLTEAGANFVALSLVEARDTIVRQRQGLVPPTEEATARVEQRKTQPQPEPEPVAS